MVSVLESDPMHLAHGWTNFVVDCWRSNEARMTECVINNSTYNSSSSYLNTCIVASSPRLASRARGKRATKPASRIYGSTGLVSFEHPARPTSVQSAFRVNLIWGLIKRAFAWDDCSGKPPKRWALPPNGKSQSISLGGGQTY